MGIEDASNSNSISQCDYVNNNNNNNNSTLVVLNVYDLNPINNYMYWFGVGIYHSGIQVHGREYGFGAHDFSASGVFEVEPRKCPGFIYRSSFTLGQTNMSRSEFRTFIENMACEYHGDTYQLISKNCNHFADDVSLRLTGKQIPGWVNRLAKLGALCSCLLPESLQVTRVKRLREYHECSEDEFAESHSTATAEESTEFGELEKLILSLSDRAGDVIFVKDAQIK
ncbi:hypothetical protein Lal_00049756 [Lupinus albus]|uniref:Putative PPPDE putative peptidase domain-containing protein n=1 Tax=Lupinus albus TaxID=3870 RepID=A0A6A5M2D0_LUPAL|nr:putative PPPDE putative peptidase domain-containing protein [Lupinus albus]KAF1867327.1 hypothetical protein Lal_00049756 [Lupinus albus]